MSCTAFITIKRLVLQAPPVSTYGDYGSYMQAVTQYYSQPATANQAYASKVGAPIVTLHIDIHVGMEKNIRGATVMIMHYELWTIEGTGVRISVLFDGF